MKLVIVESPAKAKTIEKYLGKDYKVIASKGHVVDLPKSDIGIDIENKFKPKYVVKNKLSLAAIKKAFLTADELILAVDPDREGEAIAWHIARSLKVIKPNGSLRDENGKPVVRIVFTEITKEAVTNAVANPRSIDMNLVDAQQTRRILDRLVGYQLSPLLWKKLMFGLSAGRVQSVALRLVVEKELEREAFSSQEYWNLEAGLNANKKSASIIKAEINPELDATEKEKLEVKIAELLKFNLVSFNNKKIELKKRVEIEKVIENVESEKWIVRSVDTKKSVRSPNPPFSTSTLQQAASNVLGMGAGRTMKIAQQLYEQGLITYMRTDSITLSQQALNSVRGFIESEFGHQYLSATPRIYKTKSKVAQEAHEAIRPSDISKKASSINVATDQKRLYELIWKRVMASQMADTILDMQAVKVEAAGYLFEMDGQKIVFPGFNILYHNKIKEIEIPDFVVGQELFLNMLLAEQKFTEPPARYSEATLIKALEANGIGRPSTYAPILMNIIAKKYIEKEGKYLKPTLVGRALNSLLVDHFSKIVDLKFTAAMEDDLDNIANGDLAWLDFMSSFYKGFSKSLQVAEKAIKKDDYLILGKSEEKCPLCGKKMQIKLGRFSPFLSCVDFPKCKGMNSLGEKASESVDITSADFNEKYLPAPKTDDGRDYSFKSSRFGFFWAHPDYPKVKDARPLELTSKFNQQLFGDAPKADDGTKMELRRGRFGYFWAHPKYPAVKQISKIDNKNLQEKKKELGLL